MEFKRRRKNNSPICRSNTKPLSTISSASLKLRKRQSWRNMLLKNNNGNNNCSYNNSSNKCINSSSNNNTGAMALHNRCHRELISAHREKLRPLQEFRRPQVPSTAVEPLDLVRQQVTADLRAFKVVRAVLAAPRECPLDFQLEEEVVNR